VPSAASPSPTAGAPTPLASLLPTTATIETVTQICETWGSSAPDDTITCGDAIWLALDALGPAGGTARRADFGYGPYCPLGLGECGERVTTESHVVVRTASVGSFVLRVARGSDGGLLVWPPQPVGAEPVPAFTPPVPALADVGPGAPPEVAQREAYPLCSVEDSGLAGPYDASARRCLANGVLAGQAVEFLTRGASTEGGAVLTLYRFAGAGPLVRFVSDNGAWARYACGMSLNESDLVFNNDGDCARTELAP
jgi:hypothetical protein